MSDSSELEERLKQKIEDDLKKCKGIRRQLCNEINEAEKYQKELAAGIILRKGVIDTDGTPTIFKDFPIISSYIMDYNGLPTNIPRWNGGVFGIQKVSGLEILNDTERYEDAINFMLDSICGLRDFSYFSGSGWINYGERQQAHIGGFLKNLLDKAVNQKIDDFNNGYASINDLTRVASKVQFLLWRLGVTNEKGLK